MAISLSLDQKEKAKHGEQLFPLQRYITNLSSTYPAVTAHWHKEAEFTMITDGNCTYQIQLCPYPVNAGDLIFVPPLVLHSIHSNTDPAMTSETFVFHMNYLGKCGHLRSKISHTACDAKNHPALYHKKRTSSLCGCPVNIS